MGDAVRRLGREGRDPPRETSGTAVALAVGMESIGNWLSESLWGGGEEWSAAKNVHAPARTFSQASDPMSEVPMAAAAPAAYTSAPKAISFGESPFLGQY
jgi:hypothetical protein